MRLFQNSALYPSYLPRLNELASKTNSFEERRRVFLDDRFGALHFLKPVLDGEAHAFFTNGDDQILQRSWARENGLAPDVSLEEILLAQIEHHKSEVFYNLDPVRYASAFVRKLPGCVRKSICWRVAPSGRADLTAYDAVLGNFPSILKEWEDKGCRTSYFLPSIDPVMAEYDSSERTIDVLFVGGYSRHHQTRARALERVAGLAPEWRITYRLDSSRLTRLAESALGRLLPLRKYRRPDTIAKITELPVFGRQLYELIGQSRIVLNGAIDTSGADRGNMRCFEAMGCGALLVSDTGNYPAGMKAGETMLTYDSADDAPTVIEDALDHWVGSAELARLGREQIFRLYSKSRQWQQFVELVGKI
jgi:Glycosyl transferases group 1